MLLLVCEGETINLTCQTNQDSRLKWTLSSLPENLNTQERFVYDTGVEASPFTIQTTSINFIRTSTSPLISTMSIVNITTLLNGTTIECSSGKTSLITPTTLNVFRSNRM